MILKIDFNKMFCCNYYFMKIIVIIDSPFSNYRYLPYDTDTGIRLYLSSHPQIFP